MEKKFSKTVFIIIAFLCGLIIIISPIIGILTDQVLGVLALGWIIAGILIGVLIGVVYEQPLNDDFKWRFSKDAPDKEKGIEL